MHIDKGSDAPRMLQREMQRLPPGVYTHSTKPPKLAFSYPSTIYAPVQGFSEGLSSARGSTANMQ